LGSRGLAPWSRYFSNVTIDFNDAIPELKLTGGKAKKKLGSSLEISVSYFSRPDPSTHFLERICHA
jgi:hypothetical protein